MRLQNIEATEKAKRALLEVRATMSDTREEDAPVTPCRLPHLPSFPARPSCDIGGADTHGTAGRSIAP